MLLPAESSANSAKPPSLGGGGHIWDISQTESPGTLETSRPNVGTMAYTSGFAESGNARIFYEKTGSGRPVVFCHAGVSDRRLWDPQFENPVAGFRYIRSDMRGFGESEWTPESYQPHTDIRAVIDHLRLDGFVLVGCSMGGRAAMELTVELKGRAAGLVVVGAGLPGWEPEDGGYTPPEWETLDPLWDAGDWEAIARVDVAVWGVGVGRDEAEVDPDFVAKMMEMDIKPVSTELERDEFMSWMDPPVGDRIDEIAVPSMVIVGEHDLPDISESTKHLADRIDATRHVIPGTAHLPSLERPQEFNQLLNSFLASL